MLIYVIGVWCLQVPEGRRYRVGCPASRFPWAGPYHTVIPGDIIEGFPVIEIQEVDDEQRKQCGQCHVAPQEGEGRPHQAAQLAKHLSPKPG